MESRFLRPSKKLIIIGAVALGASAGVPVAYGQAATGQQPAAGGQAATGTKNWKDRAEYDLYQKATQTQDPKARLDVLNQWQDKYPKSDYSDLRDQLMVGTLGQMSADAANRPMVVQKCEDILKRDPNNFRAAYYIAYLGPAVGGSSPQPDLLSQVESAAKVVIDQAPTAFDPAKKPPQVKQEDFDKAKTQSLGIAHNALAWVATSKNDKTTAENEYKASLEANPDQGNISALYAKMLVDDKKVPEGLFEYARAGQYTGPGPALPEATRTQMLTYYNNEYKAYHGSADGADQLLTQAKTQALPPAGLTITSAQAQADDLAKKLQDRINSDPSFKVWYAIQQQLVGDQGESYFSNSVKGLEIPGDAVPDKSFTGTVISLDPANAPTKVMVGVQDPTKPDATLTFSKPLPAAALDKVKAGQTIQFSGVADSYTKDPYMLTFGDPQIVGVQTTTPARHGRRR